MDPIFHAYTFGDQERAQMDRDGHFAFPELLTESARERLVEALSLVHALKRPKEGGSRPGSYAAEHNGYLASLIGHPQLLALARTILGEDIRYDHCVELNRPSGFEGMRWHAHGYGEENFDLGLGFVRIFFYVNGFDVDDGALTVVPGSHLYKDRTPRAKTDEELLEGWMKGKKHLETGAPLEIETLSVPPGTVIVMWTHALHGVTARTGNDTRWTVVYAYRNPGLPSSARWITEDFEKKVIPGAEGLLSLY